MHGQDVKYVLEMKLNGRPAEGARPVAALLSKRDLIKGLLFFSLEWISSISKRQMANLLGHQRGVEDAELRQGTRPVALRIQVCARTQRDGAVQVDGVPAVDIHRVVSHSVVACVISRGQPCQNPDPVHSAMGLSKKMRSPPSTAPL